MVRSRDVLAWRFKYLLQDKSAILLVREEGQTITGYTILVRSQLRDPRLSSMAIADLQAHDESPEVLEALISGALCAARERGVEMVTVSGFSAAKQEVIRRFRPYSTPLPAPGLFFKAADLSLQASLENPAAWDLSMLDGDAVR